eukprot:scaffold91979_cov31-Tisochrysis_lutea.AAC.7
MSRSKAACDIACCLRRDRPHRAFAATVSVSDSVGCPKLVCALATWASLERRPGRSIAGWRFQGSVRLVVSDGRAIAC